MNSVYAPHPLRVLLTWPHPAAKALLHTIQSSDADVDITPLASSLALKEYLREPNYYHVLCISPAEWRAFTSITRQQYAAKVSLIIFGPEETTEADFSDAIVALGLRRVSTVDEAVALLVDVYRRLAHGSSLSQCAAELNDAVSFVGDEACWPEVETPPAASITTTINRSGGVDMNGQIGEVNVDGDMVGRDKIVYQATGDQIIQTNATGAKIVQQAGGNQVNVNRITNAAPAITQTARGDQRNENVVTGVNAVKVCPHCGRVIDPSDRFCGKCGNEL